MAQSYNEVMKQAAEYRKQLNELDRKEAIQEAETLKKIKEEKEANHNPAKYKEASALFLDLVFQEINGYGRFDKSADMLNQVKRDVLDKYSYENLSKKNEIVEVIEAIPDTDIKNSNKDTSDNKNFIEGVTYEIVTDIQQCINDDYVTPEQVTLYTSSMRGSDITNVKISYYTKMLKDGNSDKKNESNNLLYKHYYIPFTGKTIGGQYADQYYDSDGYRINEVFLKLIDQDNLVEYLKTDTGIQFLSNQTTELKKINFYFVPTAINLSSLVGTDGRLHTLKRFLKKHKIPIHFILDTYWLDTITKKSHKSKQIELMKKFKNTFQLSNGEILSSTIKNNEIPIQKKLTGVTKRKPVKPKAVKKFPKLTVHNPKVAGVSSSIKSKTKKKKKTIARNKVNSASKNNLNNNLAEEAIDNEEVFETQVYDFKNKESEDTPEIETREDFEKRIKKDAQESKDYFKKRDISIFVNTENYSRVNTLISMLSEKVHVSEKEIKEIRKAITDLENGPDKEDRHLFLKYLQKLKEEKKIQQGLMNELLKIRKTMADNKGALVKYKRSPYKHTFSKPSINNGLDIHDMTYRKDGYVYTIYDDFLKQKEIQEIIDYNNSKGRSNK